VQRTVRHVACRLLHVVKNTINRVSEVGGHGKYLYTKLTLR